MMHDNKFSIPHYDSTQDDDWYLKSFDRRRIVLTFRKMTGVFGQANLQQTFCGSQLIDFYRQRAHRHCAG